MSPFGWAASAALLVGLWLAGSKKWWGFAFTIVGETTWVFVALGLGMYDLAFVCVAFVAVAVRNAVRWRREGAALPPPELMTKEQALEACRRWRMTDAECEELLK
jgi:hypothetical protein